MTGVYSQPYKFFTYSLRSVRNDERLGLAGTELIVFNNPTTIGLRLDEIRNDKIFISACDQTNPVVISGIPFKEIWMTNEEFDGSIQFIVLFGLAGQELINAIKEPKGFDKILSRLGFK